MLRVSSGALVTTDDRAVWLSTRFWLPKINVSVVPVCSNVPVPCGRQVRMTRNIGVFGFGGESFSPAVVMQALARVASEDSRIQLVLVGSPGEESTQGRRWRRVALEVGCESHVSFTGVLDAERLQDVLLGIQVMVFPDVSGPTSRKTTLAAALACGKAIVALDGPQRWEGLVRAKAVVLARDWEEVGAAISALYSDPALRGRQEKAALDFYREHMSEDVVAAKVQKFLAGIG
jgi:glycosyltransferase involved in cell wall biosynthesis